MKSDQSTTNHQIVSKQEWLIKRIELLKVEKELTRSSDKVAQLREQLPWVRIEKEYLFDTDNGKASLADLFQGRSQLIIYHFMYGPEYNAGCPTCSAITDGWNGFAIHLASHDVMLMAVSRAQLNKLQAYKKRMGWSFPWASSFESDFNYDFHASYTEEQQRTGDMELNYHKGNVQSKAHDIKAEEPVSEAGSKIAATVGTNWPTYSREAPGMSCFVLKDGIVYHTYSAYERGLDGLWGMYQWLDRAPLGRNEEGNDKWFKRNYEYKDLLDNSGNYNSCCK